MESEDWFQAQTEQQHVSAPRRAPTPYSGSVAFGGLSYGNIILDFKKGLQSETEETHLVPFTNTTAYKKIVVSSFVCFSFISMAQLMRTEQDRTEHVLV